MDVWMNGCMDESLIRKTDEMAKNTKQKTKSRTVTQRKEKTTL